MALTDPNTMERPPPSPPPPLVEGKKRFEGNRLSHGFAHAVDVSRTLMVTRRAPPRLEVSSEIETAFRHGIGTALKIRLVRTCTKLGFVRRPHSEKRTIKAQFETVTSESVAGMVPPLRLGQRDRLLYNLRPKINNGNSLSVAIRSL